MADDYEIVPEKDFDSLKKTVEDLKRNPVGNSPDGKSLKESIDRLNDSVTLLYNLFKTSAESMKIEEHDNSLVTQKIGPLFTRVEQLTALNEKIAKGIVALAEMIEDMKSKNIQKKDINAPQENKYSFDQKPIQPPAFGMPQQTGLMQPSFGQEPEMPPFGGPPQMGAQPLPRMSMPPPPNMPQEKKKGWFR